MRLSAVRLSAGFFAALFAFAQAPLSSTGNSIEFVKIAPGEFMMGCSHADSACTPDEQPAHRVQITKPFEIGKFEVTQAQWQAVMGSNPSTIKGSDHPVETVSKNDAHDFLAKLNERHDGYLYRLPTEAEWEYAARAGTSAPPASLDDFAWYAANSGDTTHPVGQKKPNAWGLYDMHGYVWEWCADAWSPTHKGASPDGAARVDAEQKERVVRGGSWADPAGSARSAFRGHRARTFRSDSVGFRCVRSAAGKEDGK